MAGASRDCQPSWLAFGGRLGWGMAKQDRDRAERLAAALRENLRKRKAQARETQPNKEPNQPASE